MAAEAGRAIRTRHRDLKFASFTSTALPIYTLGRSVFESLFSADRFSFARLPTRTGPGHPAALLRLRHTGTDGHSVAALMTHEDVVDFFGVELALCDQFMDQLVQDRAMELQVTLRSLVLLADCLLDI